MSLRVSQPLRSTSSRQPKDSRSYPVCGALPFTSSVRSWARAVPVGAACWTAGAAASSSPGTTAALSSPGTKAALTSVLSADDASGVTGTESASCASSTKEDTGAAKGAAEEDATGVGDGSIGAANDPIRPRMSRPTTPSPVQPQHEPAAMPRFFIPLRFFASFPMGLLSGCDQWGLRQRRWTLDN